MIADPLPNPTRLGDERSKLAVQLVRPIGLSVKRRQRSDGRSPNPRSVWAAKVRKLSVSLPARPARRRFHAVAVSAAMALIVAGCVRYTQSFAIVVTSWWTPGLGDIMITALLGGTAVQVRSSARSLS